MLEATTLGAAFLAGMAVGTWAGEDDVAAAWIAPGRGHSRRPLTPSALAARERWLEARSRAEGAVPELSGIDF